METLEILIPNLLKVSNNGIRMTSFKSHSNVFLVNFEHIHKHSAHSIVYFGNFEHVCGC